MAVLASVGAALLSFAAAFAQFPAASDTAGPAARSERPAVAATGQPRPANQKETGIASFMSDRLKGRKTASGQPYDPTTLVAAHPTYPLGTLLRVTNLENNRTVDVKVIDRSAAGRGNRRRIVDVSRAAAERLDFIQRGLVKATTEVLEWGADLRGK